VRDYVAIDTPENVTVGYEVAGIGSRMMAYAIDFLIRYVPFLALAIALLLAGFVLSDVMGLSWYVWIIGIIAFFSVHVLYYIGFEAFNRGQTPGKRLLGLRVVQENGRPATLYPVVVRNLLRVVDGQPWFISSTYGVALVSMFISRKSQRLGDLASGTVVVKERAYSQENVIALGYGAAHYEPPETDLGLAVSAQEFELVQRYLSRRETMTRAVQVDLGRKILEGVAARQPEHTGEALRELERHAGTEAALVEVARHFVRDHS